MTDRQPVSMMEDPVASGKNSPEKFSAQTPSVRRRPGPADKEGAERTMCRKRETNTSTILLQE
jgi:hypothetical protein